MEARGGCYGGLRVVGDYILGQKIGAGSFAVVWRARHRLLGVEVAVKEIDQKQLSNKLRDSLFKEVDILHHISHPNIIRLHEAIQSEEKIYLVLEYCTGGDLAAYINRHGRVSEGVARRYMRQLASGLQVLRENNLIHRDLKPQNLLLSTNDENALLKIGDFGFARHLTPQGLADTLCGSPLYMAPEIIQNKKYDAKADLWSVGAILFQMLTGKPPFDGNSQFQLFQNILASNEVHFPQDIIRELHVDCVDLCKSLLRHNPVERLTFEEFFSHEFLAVERISSSHGGCLHKNDGDCNTQACADPSSSSDAGGNDIAPSFSKGNSSELVEWEYVHVDPNLTSMETIPSSVAVSLLDHSLGRSLSMLKIGTGTDSQQGNAELAVSCFCSDDVGSYYHASQSVQLEISKMPSNPSRRLQFLCQYAHVITEVAKEKLNVGLHLESLSIELLALAVWKEALRICSDWLSTSEPDRRSFCIKDQELDRSMSLSRDVDFSRPDAAYSWAEQGFFAAFDRAEAISNDLQDMDGNTKMPDAVDNLFQTALSCGKRGAVDEFMGNRRSAVVAYARATTLLTFILRKATLLPLDPPFSLSTFDQERIYKYITILEAHLTLSQVPCGSTRITKCLP